MSYACLQPSAAESMEQLLNRLQQCRLNERILELQLVEALGRRPRLG